MKTVPLMLVFAVAASAGLAAQTAPPISANDKPETTATAPEPTPGSGLLGLPVSAVADPGSRKAAGLLEQMVRALGGRAYLSIESMEQSGRTYGFYHGESSGAGVLYWRFWKWPDRERYEMTKQRNWSIVYNGNDAAEITYRGAAPLESDVLADYLRRHNHSLATVLRTWLQQPGVALLYEGMVAVDRRQAEQVSVLTANNDAVSISIDMDRHLPLRVAFSWRNPTYKDRTEESEVYDGYRVVQGIMTPSNITRYRDGEVVNQRFINDTKYNVALADSMFQTKISANANATPKKR